MHDTIELKRPERWHTPFGDAMTDDDVRRLLRLAPFSQMNEAIFPERLPLAGLLRHDTRIVRASHGEVLIREGDYGHSAFLILTGKVRILLKHVAGRPAQPNTAAQGGWLGSLGRWFTENAYPEVRHASALRSWIEYAGGSRERIFLQDMPAILAADASVVLETGQIFGEMAALTRTPRSATVIAEGDDVELLEIRWQGLRDLLRFDAAWKSHIDELYRANSLRVHLRETPLLARLPGEVLQQVADATEFVTFGNFDWQHEYRKVSQEDIRERVQSEPLIARQGDYAECLLLIRNGFARLSRTLDAGERTLAYLGKGDGFGMRELTQAWKQKEAIGWNSSLRAVGYVDLLRIPGRIVAQHILPLLPDDEIDLLLDHPEKSKARRTPATRIFTQKETHVDNGLMEFLVENRYLNGTAAMVIDLDRCTRCDDCVRACATQHGNNPRFNREGPKHERFMIAHACMHCADPVCMIGCPTGAIHRDAASGVVVINDGTCIGCSTCANSCPYQNIQMVAIRNPLGEFYRDEATHQPILKATKCDLCLGQTGGPACVRACPHEALERIDLHDVETLAGWSRP